MAWQYSEKTTQLFNDAVQGKPGTHLGEISDPDGVGEHGSMACGDAMRFTFRVDKHPTDPTRDIIVDAKYLTFGCTSAIASSEALCALLAEQKLTPLAALKITNDDIVKYLGGLPAQKIHCSVMGAEALEAAVTSWAQKRGVNLRELGVELPSHEEQEGRLVCNCFGLTEPYLQRKIRELGLKSIPEVTNAVKAGGACMSCHHAAGGLQDVLDAVWGRNKLTIEPLSPRPVESVGDPERETLSPFKFFKAVERVLEEHIRPMLHQDGGDLDIVDIKDQIVYAQLEGACAGCPGAKMTLKTMVEETLKKQVDPRIRVIAV